MYQRCLFNVVNIFLIGDKRMTLDDYFVDMFSLFLDFSIDIFLLSSSVFLLTSMHLYCYSMRDSRKVDKSTDIDSMINRHRAIV